MSLPSRPSGKRLWPVMTTASRERSRVRVAAVALVLALVSVAPAAAAQGPGMAAARLLALATDAPSAGSLTVSLSEPGKAVPALLETLPEPITVCVEPPEAEKSCSTEELVTGHDAVVPQAVREAQAATRGEGRGELTLPPVVLAALDIVWTMAHEALLEAAGASGSESDLARSTLQSPTGPTPSGLGVWDRHPTPDRVEAQAASPHDFEDVRASFRGPYPLEVRELSTKLAPDRFDAQDLLAPATVGATGLGLGLEITVFSREGHDGWPAKPDRSASEGLVPGPVLGRDRSAMPHTTPSQAMESSERLAELPVDLAQGARAASPGGEAIANPVLASGTGTLLAALALCLVLLPLFHRLRTPARLLEHPFRNAIYRALAAEGALAAEEGAKIAGISRITARYHLLLLQDQGLVRSVRVGKKLLFFRSGDATLTHRARRILEIPASRRVLAALTQNPEARVRELAEVAGLPVSTAYWHVNRLEAQGLIVTQREPRALRYLLTPLAREVLESDGRSLRDWRQDPSLPG